MACVGSSVPGNISFQAVELEPLQDGEERFPLGRARRARQRAHCGGERWVDDHVASGVEPEEGREMRVGARHLRADHPDELLPRHRRLVVGEVEEDLPSEIAIDVQVRVV
eukprot:EG_transcript_50972